jgi:hypothetical protein
MLGKASTIAWTPACVSVFLGLNNLPSVLPGDLPVEIASSSSLRLGSLFGVDSPVKSLQLLEMDRLLVGRGLRTWLGSSFGMGMVGPAISGDGVRVILGFGVELGK